MVTGSGFAEVWMTTPDAGQLLAPQPGVRFDAGDEDAQVIIDVDETQRFQTMSGFGAAVTGSAAWLIQQRLSAGERAELMRSLFDPRDGIGLSFVRTTMGASDFSLRDYTYADAPPGAADPQLARFSIEPDRAEILPVLRQAIGINPDLRVLATPWSAPAWMKTSGSLAGGSLKPEAYGTYAKYFRRFLDAYAREGVPVYAVSVQNEPLHEAPYPSMRMSAEEQAAFVRDHLGRTGREPSTRAPLALPGRRNLVLRRSLDRGSGAGPCFRNASAASSSVRKRPPISSTQPPMSIDSAPRWSAGGGAA